ncbi:MAG: DUF424 domain-containing protein [Candidatus Aenigmatarchaeota archaeon]
MFCFNHFEADDDFLLSVCDEDILGKTFSEGEITLKVKEDFYFSKKAEEADLKNFFEKATIINAVGEEIVNLLVNEDLVEEDKILVVEGVPHAQVVKIE